MGFSLRVRGFGRWMFSTKRNSERTVIRDLSDSSGVELPVWSIAELSARI